MCCGYCRNKMAAAAVELLIKPVFFWPGQGAGGPGYWYAQTNQTIIQGTNILNNIILYLFYFIVYLLSLEYFHKIHYCSAWICRFEKIICSGHTMKFFYWQKNNLWSVVFLYIWSNKLLTNSYFLSFLGDFNIVYFPSL